MRVISEGTRSCSVSHSSNTAKVIVPELILDGFTATGSMATMPAVIRPSPGEYDVPSTSVTVRSVEPRVCEGMKEMEMIA